MGLIKALVGAVDGVLADQWKEFFYCDSLDKEIMMEKGIKRMGGRTSNTKGSDNVISNGSGIAVADGQCMIIVEQGQVVEVCAEPGEYTFDKSLEPSIFEGPLGKGIIDSFKTMGRRFTFGGDTGRDQRVYYINIKELIDNKFGTANPIPFRVVDRNIGLDIDVAVRCSGIYSYKIADPVRFYTNLAGNVADRYRREEIEAQLKTEFVSALQPAFADISKMEVRPSDIPAHAERLAELMNSILSEKWGELRGFEVVSIGLNPITLPEEDAALIKELQKAAVMRDPNMAGAALASAQADALRGAATNEGGAMMGMMGIGMTQNVGGMSSANLFEMGQKQQAGAQAAQAAGVVAGAGGGQAPTWKCECGTDNTGKFCSNCGKPEPLPAGQWLCECGTANTGKFCSNCGKPKPAGPTCSKCGYEVEGATAPKFCPECGNQF